MPFISGLLGLGTAITSDGIAEPPGGTGYSRAPISFDKIVSGTVTNTVNCLFGPVLGVYGSTPWGALNSFQLFDQYGNPAWTGSLEQTVTPVAGAQINVIVGAISIVVASAGPGAQLDFNFAFNSQYLVVI